MTTRPATKRRRMPSIDHQKSQRRRGPPFSFTGRGEWSELADRLKEHWVDAVAREERVKSARASGQGSSANKVSNFDKSNSVLKREVYSFTRAWEAAGVLDKVFTAIVRKHWEDHKNGHFMHSDFWQNPFRGVLYALSSAKDCPIKISRDEIKKFGSQLKYADRHDVPPQFLIGFLMQSGDVEDICGKLERGEYESWHPLAKALVPNVTEVRCKTP